MKFLVKKEEQVNNIISKKNDDLLKNLEVKQFFLDEEKEEIEYICEFGNEAVLVLFFGKIIVEHDIHKVQLVRNTQFNDLPQAIYFRSGEVSEKIRIKALNKARFVIATTAYEVSPEIKKENFLFIPIPDTQVEELERGKGPFQRKIRNILSSNSCSLSLLCGETINPPGKWSSFPPHKHDTLQAGVESVHEEVYVFSINPIKGWGYQEIYCKQRGISNVCKIEDGDAIKIPFGYHPVSAPPGYTLCYFWVLSGKIKTLYMFDDPEHKWIKQAYDKSEKNVS